MASTCRSSAHSPNWPIRSSPRGDPSDKTAPEFPSQGHLREWKGIGLAAMSSDWDLMQIHISALYRLDERNRLLAVNEPGPPWPDDPLPPRLYVGRTRAGHVWRFRHDLPESLVAELESMLAAEPV